MKHLISVSLVIILCSLNAKAQQGIAINGTGTNPDPSAMLDVQSTSKGMLVPRMTAVQRMAITSPATGLMVFDTDSSRFIFFNGTAWNTIPAGNTFSVTNGLSLTGNTLTSTVNGVTATSDAVSGVNNTSSGNTLSTTVNGVTGSTVPLVNSVSNTSTGNSLGTSVNGVSSSTVPIINSNGLGLSGGMLTSTVNGVASTPVDLSTAITTTHTAGLSGNTLTSTVNGVNATTPTVSTVANTSTGNSLTTSVNGIGATAVNIVNSNGLSISGSQLTSTVNGVASTPVDLSTAITTTNGLNLTGNTITSTVNGVAATSNAVSGVSNSSSGNTMNTTVNGVSGSPATIINSTALSLSGGNLTATVNGVSSAPVDLSTAITTTHAVNTTGNTVTSTVNGVTDTAVAVTSNGLNLTGSQLTSTVNGVASSPVDLSTAITTTNGLSLSGNTLSSTVNGVTATSNAVSGISNTLTGSSLTTTVNGVASSPVDLSAAITTTNSIGNSGNTLTTSVNGVTDTTEAVTSNGLSLTGSSLTSTVNGIASAPVDLSTAITTTHDVSMSGNTLTSTVNGVSDTTTSVTSVGIASSGNNMSTTVNGMSSSTTPIININGLSLSGSNLTSTVNGIASAPVDLSTAISTTHTINTTGNTVTSTVNGISDTAQAVTSVSSNLSGSSLTTTVNGVTSSPVDLSAMGDNLGNHTATQNIRLNNHWLSNDGDAEGINVSDLGRVGIGMAASASDRFVVSGNATFTSGIVSFNSNWNIQTGADFWLEKSGTRYLTIYGTGGNVGIGTPTPTTRLDVSGTTRTTNFQMTTGGTSGYVLQSDASGNASWVAPSGLSITETDPQVSSTTTNKIPKWNGTTLTDGLVYDNGSGIGIGTSTIPSESGLVIGAMNTGDEGGQFQLNAAGSHLTAYHIDNYRSGYRILSGTNTGSSLVRFAIDSTGYVGVGLGASVFATERLQVNGNIKTTDTVKTGKFVMTNGATSGYILQTDASGNASWVSPSVTETDPQVSSTTTNKIPKWNGTTLTDGLVYDNGSGIGIGTSTIPSESGLVIGAMNTGDEGGQLQLNAAGSHLTAYHIDNYLSGFRILSGTNTGSSLVRFAIDSSGYVGVGLGASVFATERLQVNGNIKTTDTVKTGRFVMTNGATNGYVLRSDASGNASWVNPVVLTTDTMSMIQDADADTRIRTEASADEDKIRFDLGGTERWVMNGYRLEPMNTGQSTFIGEGAGAADDGTTNKNVAVGYHALNTSTGSVGNTAIGYSALTNATANSNTAVGYFSAAGISTGTWNVALGQAAMANSTTAAFNTAIGGQSLVAASDSNNVSIGMNTMANHISGSTNTAVGTGAGANNVTGGGNIFLGYQAGANELGGGKLYIDNSGTSTPLIFGDFTTDSLRVNGRLNINGYYTMPSSAGTNGYLLQTNGTGQATWVAPSTLSITETDPQVSSATSNMVPKWNGTTLTDGSIFDNGVIGLNTTSPVTQSRMTVQGSVSYTGVDGNWSLGGNRGFVDYSSPYIRIGTTNGGGSAVEGILFIGNGSERMRMNGSGYLGINTAAPTERLHVNGNIKAVDTIKTSKFQMTNGATNGYVLRSDASGNANWVNPTALSITETDPQVSSVATSRVPIWNGSSLVDGTITDNGNVGIGTTTPSQALEVNGNEKVNGFIYAEGASGSSTSLILNQNGTDNFNGISLTRDGDPRWYTGMTDSNSNYIFRRGGTYDDVVITETGFVGIGTSTPTTTLEVNGGGKMNNITLTNGASSGYVLQSDASGNASWVAPTGLSVTETDPQVSSTTTNKVPKWNGTTLTDGSIYDNGVIGINTTSPVTQSKVTVNGSASFTNYDANWFAGGNRGFVDYLTTGYLRLGALNGGGSAVGGIVFVGNSDEKMIMDGTGHLAIGIDTTIAQSLLAVNGSASFRGSDGNFTLGGNRAFTDYSGGYMRLGTLNGGGAAVNGIQFLGNGTERMRVDPNGYLGINTTSPTERLHVNGNIKAVDTVKTSKFQMTNGAINGYILQTDASGNANWVNPTALSISETDPQVSSSTTNRIPKWTGTTLTDGIVTDNGSSVTVNGDANITSTGSYLLTLTTNNTIGTRLSLYNTSTGGGQYQIISTGSGNSEGAGNLLFNNTSGGSVMELTSTNRVAIGNTAPTERLDVTGNIKSSDTIKSNRLQLTNGATSGYVLKSDASGNATWVNPTTLTITETDPQVGSTTTNKVPKWNGTALVDGGITDNGTTVTIGNGAFASPALDVSGYQTISNAGGNADLNFNTSSRSTIFPNGSNTPTNLNLQIRSKGTGTMEINSDNTGNVQMVSGGGNVMIGTGTPAARLSVVTASTSGTGGLIAQMGSSTYQGRIAFYDETATIGPKIEFAAGNTAQITNAGSLAIMPGGTGVGVNQANPSAMLDVNGSFKMGSSGTVLTSVIKSTYTSSLSVVPAGGFLLLTIPVTGAAVGASVSVSPSTDMPTGLVIASSRVSAAGTVTVKIYNATAGAVGIGALDYYVTVIN